MRRDLGHRFLVDVDNPLDFRVAFRIGGHWPAIGTMYLGVEGCSQSGEYWMVRLNLRTGQVLIGGPQDSGGGDDTHEISGNHILPGLFSGTRADGAPRGSRRNQLGRSGRRLQQGVVWGLQMKEHCLSFFCICDGHRHELGDLHDAKDPLVLSNSSIPPFFGRSCPGYRPFFAFRLGTDIFLHRE